jgi:signal peptidase I
MNQNTQSPRDSMSLLSKVLVVCALVAAFHIIALIVLRLCGLIWPFSVPTGAMTPAVSSGDHIVMEGMTYHSREPRRGDVAVFRTDGIPSLPPRTFYVKRVVGEPGERVRFAGGKLLVNDKQVSLSNAEGEIVYEMPQSATTMFPQSEVTVPAGSYFVVGDNSTNSFDSRCWGCVPRKNILGRVSFCYWPPGRIGRVK